MTPRCLYHDRFYAEARASFLNSPRRRHHFVGCIFHGVAYHKIQTRIHQNLLAFIHIRTFQPQHHWKLDIGFLGRFHYARGQRIHAQNAAKNVDQHCLHVLVAQQDLKSMCYLLRAGTTADIEKVRRHAARVFDDVHRGHGQARAVHHAALRCRRA